MAGYEISVGSELLPGLLSGQDGLAKLVETVLNLKWIPISRQRFKLRAVTKEMRNE